MYPNSMNTVRFHEYKKKKFKLGRVKKNPIDIFLIYQRAYWHVDIIYTAGTF